MERISDFFKELKERLSNPFIFSFTVAWLVINWKVPIALLIYNYSELRTIGYNSYFDFVKQYYNRWYFLWFPIIIALAYTFIFPLFRNVIYAFQAWIKTWGTNWNLSISKEGKVSMNRYVKLREQYHTQTKVLEDLYNAESSFKNENDTLKTERIQLVTERNTLSKELIDLKEKNTLSPFYGDWQLTFTDPLEKKEKNYRLNISANIMKVLPSDNNPSMNFNINNTFYNDITRQFCFILTSTSGGKKIPTIQLLAPNDSMTEFTGVQLNSVPFGNVFQDNIPLKYTKVKYP